MQIENDARLLGMHCGFSIQAVFGGVDYQKQREGLRQGVDVIIATPGRLIDYLKQKVFSLQAIEMLVIDEADRMFDLGFIADLRYIMRHLPPFEKRQNLMFSATLNARVMELAYEFMQSPEQVVVEGERITADAIEQVLYHVGRQEKFPLLLGLLRRDNMKRTIIFTNTKREAEHLYARLAANDFACRLISGDVPQEKRLRIMRQFKEGSLPILIATDVASRGLHIEGVSHVINYDLPEDREDYVHRIGRTARAGARGKAISFADEVERAQPGGHRRVHRRQDPGAVGRGRPVRHRLRPAAALAQTAQGRGLTAAASPDGRGAEQRPAPRPKAPAGRVAGAAPPPPDSPVRTGRASCPAQVAAIDLRPRPPHEPNKPPDLSPLPGRPCGGRDPAGLRRALPGRRFRAPPHRRARRPAPARPEPGRQGTAARPGRPLGRRRPAGGHGRCLRDRRQRGRVRGGARLFRGHAHPHVAIAGNHDYYFRDMADTEGHYRISPPDEQAVKLERFRRTFNLRRLYSSRRLGGYLLVFLSTDHPKFGTGIGPEQQVWLRRLLARNRRTPTIVFFHAPLRGTQAKFRHYIDRPSAIAQPEGAVHGLLAANPQVFLWVSGHTHTPPTEPSFAAPINRYDGRVTNIHSTDLRGATLWTNSLYLHPDRVEVRTFDHTANQWLPHLDRTITPPLLP